MNDQFHLCTACDTFNNDIPSTEHCLMEQWFRNNLPKLKHFKQGHIPWYNQHDHDTLHRSTTLDPLREPLNQHSEYTTKSVCFQDPKPASDKENLSLCDLVLTMHSFNICDANYAVLYAQCIQCFLEVAKTLPKPDMSQSTSLSSMLQTLSQTWPQSPTASTPSMSAPAFAQLPQHQHHQLPQLINPSPEVAALFGRQPWTDGCAFCTLLGHLLQSCTTAIKYINSRCIMVKDSHIHLPNGQLIPNNGSGHGLKHAIDAWLTANSAPTSDISALIQPSVPTPFHHDPPPHTALSFKAVQSEVHMAQITDTAPEDPPDDNAKNKESELYDLFEVLTTERTDWKKCNTQLPQPQTMPPPPQLPVKISTTAPPLNTLQLQFCYQSNAEDQKLTSQLLKWLLEGKLTQTTPAHILAASVPIHKDLSKQLHTCHIKATAFKQTTLPSLAAQIEPDYTLPLQEINILVGGHSTEAGVIDPGLQIIAIRKDLADEVSACINPGICLEMESTNGAKSWTLGCTKYLNMNISDIPFKIHAHVIENTLFCVLLG